MANRGQKDKELKQLEKNTPMKEIIKRSSRKGSDSQLQGNKPEVKLIDGIQTRRKVLVTPKARETPKNKRVKLQMKSKSDEDTEPESFDCEYCLAGSHESVIGCEKCAKSGCPECTDLPPFIHELIGKWRNLHWYCKICEVDVRNFCVNPAQVRDSSKTTDLNDKGAHLEQMMEKLEKRMEDMMTKNEKIVNSYAQAVKVSINPDTMVNNKPQGVQNQKVTTLERQAVHILNEYTDRERGGKQILLFITCRKVKKTLEQAHI